MQKQGSDSMSVYKVYLSYLPDLFSSYSSTEVKLHIAPNHLSHEYL